MTPAAVPAFFAAARPDRLHHGGRQARAYIMRLPNAAQQKRLDAAIWRR